VFYTRECLSLSCNKLVHNQLVISLFGWLLQYICGAHDCKFHILGMETSLKTKRWFILFGSSKMQTWFCLEWTHNVVQTPNLMMSKSQNKKDSDCLPALYVSVVLGQIIQVAIFLKSCQVRMLLQTDHAFPNCCHHCCWCQHDFLLAGRACIQPRLTKMWHHQSPHKLLYGLFCTSQR